MAEPWVSGAGAEEGKDKGSNSLGALHEPTHLPEEPQHWPREPGGIGHSVWASVVHGAVGTKGY